MRKSPSNRMSRSLTLSFQSSVPAVGRGATGSGHWIGSFCYRPHSIYYLLSLMRLSIYGDLLMTAWGSMRLKAVFIDDVLPLHTPRGGG